MKELTARGIVNSRSPEIIMIDGKECVKIHASKEEIAWVGDHKAEVIAQIKRQAVENAELKERWAAEREAKAAEDQQYLDKMNAEAEALIAQIPADHVQVTVEQTGDMDGDPILRYSVDGFEINWSEVNMLGCAEAVREGAWGAFATVRIASISRQRLEELKAESVQKDAERAEKAAAREKELTETEIPQGDIMAYNRYHGDGNAAWEAEDEQAWASILHWGPYIEAQGKSNVLLHMPISDDLS